MLSPSRYFIEGMAVAEMRALRVQHGFTEYLQFEDEENYMNTALLSVGFESKSLGLHDPHVFEESRNGWYWGVLPAILVGLSIHLLAFLMVSYNCSLSGTTFVYDVNLLIFSFIVYPFSYI